MVFSSLLLHRLTETYRDSVRVFEQTDVIQDELCHRHHSLLSGLRGLIVYDDSYYSLWSQQGYRKYTSREEVIKEEEKGFQSLLSL